MNLNNLKKLIPLEQSGSINDTLVKNNMKLGSNEGNNSYTIVEKQTSSSLNIPYTTRSELEIYLTDSDTDMVEFHKSFVNITLSMDIIFDGGFPLLDTEGKPAWCPADTTDVDLLDIFKDNWDQNPLLVDIAKHQYIFVGFKNSTDAIGELKICSEANTIEDTNTTQYQTISFAIGAVKPHMEKNNKKNVFSLWENVHGFNQSMCGTYISYYDMFKQANSGFSRINVSFPITINFDDILHFLNFDAYPRFLFENLSFKCNIVPNALVWCCVDPKASIKDSLSNIFPSDGNNIMLFNQVADVIAPHGISEVYDKRFVQFQAPGRACTNVYAMVDKENGVDYIKYASFGHKDLTLRCEQISVVQAISYIHGYAVKPIYKQDALMYYSENQWVIPAEYVQIQSFNSGPNSNGLNVQSQFNLRNAKSIIILFPEQGTDTTVFKNPYLQELSVQINSKYYPYTKLDTTSSEFLRLQLQAAGLDTIFTCTESFENSYSEIEGFVYPVRGITYGDNTDFMYMIPLERENATPFTFDGYKGSGSESIRITGQFIQQINPLQPENTSIYNKVQIDNYAILNRYDKEPGKTDPDNPTSQFTVPVKPNTCYPFVLIVTDSFWVFQVNQMPKYYCTGREWSEILQSDYNAKFNQLVDKIKNILRNVQQ
jgi:hypothetical protein